MVFIRVWVAVPAKGLCRNVLDCVIAEDNESGPTINWTVNARYNGRGRRGTTERGTGEQ